MPYLQHYKNFYLKGKEEERRPLETNQSFFRPWEQNVAPREKLHCKFSDCSVTFKRESELRRHELSVHDRNTETCHVCHQIFTRKDNLTRHIKLKHKNPMLKAPCEFCNKMLSRQDSASRHKTTCLKNPINSGIQKGKKGKKVLCSTRIKENLPLAQMAKLEIKSE